MVSTSPKTASLDNFDTVSTKLDTARKTLQSVIFGQEEVIDNALITLVAGGHMLLVGVPGLGKTLLVETLATVAGLSHARIQCTPDLMPADILGSEVLDEDSKGKRHFRFIEGPVFCQFLMADEINRASPRTQSALLQAMQERSVTVAGQSRPLPQPFHVLATQNPLEQEGTYPLPEAQLDRFLMQIDVTYPDLEAEKIMLLATTTGKKQAAKTALSQDDLLAAQKLVREMPLSDAVLNGVLDLVRRARPGKSASKAVNDYILWAPGPRASQALVLAARARALLQGREIADMSDVLALAVPVLKHRMALNHKAYGDDVTLDTIIAELAQGL